MKCSSRVMLMAMQGHILDSLRLKQVMPYIPDENNHVKPLLEISLAALRLQFAPLEPSYLPMWACLVGFAKRFKTITAPKAKKDQAEYAKKVKAQVMLQDQAVEWARIGHPAMDKASRAYASSSMKKRGGAADAEDSITIEFPPGPHKVIDAAFDE